MSYSVINQIATSFDDAIKVVGSGSGKPQRLSRYFGGHSRTSHPFVNGYWQLFLSPPERIFAGNSNNAFEWFHATAEGFTPPSRNLNKADLPGQGGVGSSWITGQTLQRTFSITHREYREMPMALLYQQWTAIIAPQFGVSEFGGHEWEADTYKGHAFVIMTKPTSNESFTDWELKKEDIEDVWYFDGVWPENQPWDSLSHDISSNDIVQYTINFSFDGWPLNKTDDGVIDKALEVAMGFTYESTFDIYKKDLSEMKQGTCPEDDLNDIL